MSDEAAATIDCERMGVEEVRLTLAAGAWPSNKRYWAIRWLAKKDHDDALLRDSSQAEQIALARSANDAAWAAADAAREANMHATKANIIAAAALAAAIIAIIVSLIAIFRHIAS